MQNIKRRKRGVNLDRLKEIGKFIIYALISCQFGIILACFLSFIYELV